MASAGRNAVMAPSEQGKTPVELEQRDTVGSLPLAAHCVARRTIGLSPAELPEKREADELPVFAPLV
jgi:hypothetical protein